MYKPCISIDVEDWLQSTWDRNFPISQIASDNTLRLLDILDELSIRTTMFIQGKFAKVFPNTIKQIDIRGHEIASHGYAHIEIFNQTKDEFRSDVLLSKNILEDLTSKRVIGYRAPDFSIIKKSIWALPILAELNFEYDSSIFPINHKRYGIRNFTTEPAIIELGNSLRITEYPIATFKVLKKNFPIGGGGYHRLLPGFIFRIAAGLIVKTKPFIFYCHPYEFNPLEFKTVQVAVPTLVKLHQGIGRNYFEARFRKFIKKFGGQSIYQLHINSVWQEVDLQRYVERFVIQ